MKINILKGDITEIPVDAVVNAANSSLLGGGGVDGAIHRKGGQAILEDCMAIRNKQGGCKTGEAVITTAGKLPAKYVIHTVGPVWNGGKNKEPELLAQCYRNSLQLALENGVKSISFPNISTGIYGFPKDRAIAVVKALMQELPQSVSDGLEAIHFVCFDEENFKLYEEAFG